jgi:hypothetical protein
MLARVQALAAQTVQTVITAHPKVILVLLLFPLGLYEGTQLMVNGHSTISDGAWDIRFDAIGRFILIPLCFWIPFHFCFRTRTAGFTWWDVLFIGVGLAIPIIEAKTGVLMVLAK